MAIEIIHKKDKVYIIDKKLKPLNEKIFSDDFLQEQALVYKTQSGRSDTLFFEWNKLKIVKKHYYRGGLMSKISQDKYFYLGNKFIRAYAEFYLLIFLNKKNMRSPVPLGLRVVKNGLFYTCDLLTQEIENSISLADLVQNKNIKKSHWQNIGQEIARFHNIGLHHADLNSNNILLVKAVPYLIDFDKCKIKKCATRWQQKNLRRLLRSLKKLTNFNEQDFQILKNSYKNIN
ncbi:MAG: 3-deoxy-D-manno-octulosonic acid kinase [Gammaproteobacteria bacterium]|nr:MAG: 3-deoxy-D-manno-octulosonic acid kinase [Gammaproteobacteria bacterium]